MVVSLRSEMETRTYSSFLPLALTIGKEKSTVLVSPGIEHGYIVFPSQKIIVYSFVWRTAIA
jgi:hypothetical protein